MTENPPNDGNQPEPPVYPGQQPYTGEGQQYPPAPPAPAASPVGGQWGQVAPKHPQSMTVLVVGILSLVLCQVLGPVAWVMGNKALREIDANPTAWQGRSEVNAGRILGIIATVLLIVSVVVLVGFIVLVAIGLAVSPEFASELENMDDSTYALVSLFS